MAGERRRFAVMLRFAAQSGAGGRRVHGLAVLVLTPPPADLAPGQAERCVAVHRALHYRLPFDPDDHQSESWIRRIDEYLKRKGEEDPEAKRLQGDFDAAWRRPFDDPARLRAYVAAIERSAAAGGRPAGRHARMIDETHKMMLEGVGGGEGWTADFETEDLGVSEEAAAPETGGAPGDAEGEAAAAERPEIPFRPVPFKGRGARELRPGDVVVPEANRSRQWRVTDVRSDPRAGTVVVDCSFLGPAEEGEIVGAEGALRIPSEILVPLAEEYGIVSGEGDGEVAAPVDAADVRKAPTGERPRPVGGFWTLVQIGAAFFLLYVAYRFFQ